MNTEKTVKELVQMRYSCRTYSDFPIEPAIKEKLIHYAASPIKGLMGEYIRINLVESTDEDLLAGDALEYGFIKNARNFIVGVIQNSERSYESYGYVIEDLVLKATALGLGTCWVGYFNPSFFSSIGLKENEISPSIVVIGHPATKRTFTDKFIHFAARASSRKKWNRLFFSGDLNTPLSPEIAGKYTEPLEMLRMAPSSGNSQPWIVLKEKGKPVFHFFMRVVNKNYHKRHLHNIDMGIGMSHFFLSAEENKLNGIWTIDNPPEIVLPENLYYTASWIGKS